MNNLLLAIDTTHEYGSVALLSADRLIQERLVHAPDGFGHVIFDEVARLDCRLEDVVCFAAASGPGSFTGVRVGLACVKGLAEGMGRPVVAVSNLEALSTFGASNIRAVVMDARRGEIYGAVYDADRNLLRPETVQTLSVWLKTLPEGEVEFISPDFSRLDVALTGTTAPRAIAAAVGKIAWARVQAGETQDPAAIDANYVRRSDAEILFGRK